MFDGFKSLGSYCKESMNDVEILKGEIIGICKKTEYILPILNLESATLTVDGKIKDSRINVVAGDQIIVYPPTTFPDTGTKS